MTHFLCQHDRQYRLDANDMLSVFSSAFTAMPYAKRHFSLMTQKSFYGHLILGSFECIPILGAIVGLIERFVHLFFCTERENSMEKMMRNSVKAAIEHRIKSDAAEPYAAISVLPSLAMLLQSRPLLPLYLSYSQFAHQGIRAKMEDAHFFYQLEHGFLMGVLDGHGGVEVARHCALNIAERFDRIFEESRENIRKTFMKLVEELHREAADRAEWGKIGTTMVISYIEKKTHLIYTATVGDSEANIYRKRENGEYMSIPLSCVRDWGSKKDAERAAKVLNKPEIAFKWPLRKKSKSLRVASLNLSRAIGDAAKHPPLIFKPKITVNLLRAGDCLVLACDGLKDYVLERAIVQKLGSVTSRNIAATIGHLAFQNPKLSDNVTVIAFAVT